MATNTEVIKPSLVHLVMDDQLLADAAVNLNKQYEEVRHKIATYQKKEADRKRDLMSLPVISDSDSDVDLTTSNDQQPIILKTDACLVGLSKHKNKYIAKKESIIYEFQQLLHGLSEDKLPTVFQALGIDSSVAAFLVACGFVFVAAVKPTPTPNSNHSSIYGTGSGSHLTSQIEVLKSQLEAADKERKELIEERDNLKKQVASFNHHDIRAHNTEAMSLMNLNQTNTELAKTQQELAINRPDLRESRWDINQAEAFIKQMIAERKILITLAFAIVCRFLENSKTHLTRVNRVLQHVPIDNNFQVSREAIHAGNRASHSISWDVVEILYKDHLLTPESHGAIISHLFGHDLGTRILCPQYKEIINMKATMKGASKSWTKFTNSVESDAEFVRCHDLCIQRCTKLLAMDGHDANHGTTAHGKDTEFKTWMAQMTKIHDSIAMKDRERRRNQ